MPLPLSRTSLSRTPPSFWLVLTTAVVVVLFVAAALYSGHMTSGIDRMAEDITGNADPSIRSLSDARTELHSIAKLITVRFRDDHPAIPRAELEAHRLRMHGDVSAYLSLPFFPTERERREAVDPAMTDVERQTEALLAKLDIGDLRGAAAVRDGPLAEAMEKADAALGRQVAFDASQSTRLGHDIERARAQAERAAAAFDALAVALAAAMLIVAVNASRQHVRALERARDAEGAMTRRLEAVARGSVAIADHVGRGSLTDVLQVIVDSARALAGAEVAALGIGNDRTRRFDPFVHAGVDPALMDRLGAPHPAGVLGIPIEQGRTLRVDDVARDARFHGLPEGHPRIGPFLGVPIRHGEAQAGHLYLGRPPGAAPFTEQDTRAVELLATFACMALQNAGLCAALRDEIVKREDLLSMVSHDLRSPLSAIATAAQLVQQRAAAGESPARRHAEVIARNAGRMERMIADLLTAAKLQEGKLTIEPKGVA